MSVVRPKLVQLATDDLRIELASKQDLAAVRAELKDDLARLDDKIETM